MAVADRIDPERAWLGTVTTLLAVLVGGSLLAPELVYDRFLWHYFWGPVVADANNAVCAVRATTGADFLYSQSACSSASAGGGIVARPGYTAVSEVGYAVTLLLALFGLVFLLRWLDVGRDRGFFYALLPYMFLGGALRVVEDANDAVPQGADALISYPLNTLIISPVIYFTMFFLTLAVLVVSVLLANRDVVSRYEYPLAAFGVVALLANLGYLFALAFTTDYVSLVPQVTVITILVATAITAGVWAATRRYWPAIHAGTGWIGAVVIWAHSVDGAANVLLLDWWRELGLGQYTPKHPANRFVIETTQAVLPASVTDAIGATWPFLLIKVAVALFVVSIFDDSIFEESPRYSILLLVAIVAVGLGPGTRDMLRATFGI